MKMDITTINVRYKTLLALQKDLKKMRSYPACRNEEEGRMLQIYQRIIM